MSLKPDFRADGTCASEEPRETFENLKNNLVTCRPMSMLSEVDMKSLWQETSDFSEGNKPVLCAIFKKKGESKRRAAIGFDDVKNMHLELAKHIQELELFIGGKVSDKDYKAACKLLDGLGKTLAEGQKIKSNQQFVPFVA